MLFDMKSRELAFYSTYALFFALKFVLTGSLFFLLFLAVPFIGFSRGESGYKVRLLQRPVEAGGFILSVAAVGVLAGMGSYSLFLIVLSGPALILYLRTGEASGSLVLGFYLWSAIVLLAYLASLLGFSASAMVVPMFLAPVVLAGFLLYRSGRAGDLIAGFLAEALPVFFITFLVFSTVLGDVHIPRSIGALVYERAFVVFDSLESMGLIASWDYLTEGGMAAFITDTPLYFMDIGVLHYFLSVVGAPVNLTYTLNMVVFHTLFILAASLSLLFRRAGRYASLAFMLFPLTSYGFVHDLAYLGIVKWASALPFWFYLLSRFSSKKKVSPYLGFFAGLAVLHHFVGSLEMVVFLASSVFILLLSSNLDWRMYAGSAGDYAVFGVLMLLVSGVYVVPTVFFNNVRQSPHEGLSLSQSLGPDKIVKSLGGLGFFGEWVFNFRISHSWTDNKNTFLLLLASLGFLAWGLKCRGLGGLRPLFSGPLAVPAAFFGGLAFFLVFKGWILQTTIGMDMEFGRAVYLFSMLFISGVLYAARQILGERGGWVVGFIVLVFLLNLFVVRGEVMFSYKENFQSQKVSETGFLNVISSAPRDGKWVSYGIWEGVSVLLPTITGSMDAMTHFNQAHHTRTVLEEVRGGLGGEPEVFLAKTPVYLKNQMVNTGTRYVWFDACNPIGGQALMHLQSQVSGFARGGKCLVVGFIPETALAAKVSPAYVELDEQALYSMEGSHNIVWPVGGESDFRIGVKDASGVPESVPLDFKRLDYEGMRVSGGILPGDWVLVREKWFPLWKAFQDGVELEVYKANTGMMLVQASVSKPITFIFDKSGVLSYSALASLAGLLGGLTLFYRGGSDSFVAG